MLGRPVARGIDFIDEPGVVNIVDPDDFDDFADSPTLFWKSPLRLMPDGRDDDDGADGDSADALDDDDGADGVHGNATAPPPRSPDALYTTWSRPEQHCAPRHRRHRPANINCIASDRSSMDKSGRRRNN